MNDGSATTLVRDEAVHDDHPILLQFNHYCDACTSARATHRVWIDRYRLTEEGPKSLDLVLCGHHISKHFDALDGEGYEIEEV